MSDGEVRIKVVLDTAQSQQAVAQLTEKVKSVATSTRSVLGGAAGQLGGVGSAAFSALGGQSFIGSLLRPLNEAGAGVVNQVYGAVGVGGAAVNEAIFGRNGPNYFGAIREGLGNLSASSTARDRVTSLAGALAAQGAPLQADALKYASEITYAQEKARAAAVAQATDAFDRSSGGLHGNEGFNSAADKIAEAIFKAMEFWQKNGLKNGVYKCMGE